MADAESPAPAEGIPASRSPDLEIRLPAYHDRGGWDARWGGQMMAEGPKAAGEAPATSNSRSGRLESPSVGPGPEISVLVMASRHREFVFDAIDSVRRQTVDPKRYELIVIHDYDDPELDRSVDRAGGSQVRVEPHSIGAAIQAGLHASRSPILTFLDDDDRYAPGRLTFVLDSFRRIPDLVFLKNGFVVIDSQGKPQPRHPFRSRQRRNTERIGRVVLRGEDRIGQLRNLPELGLGFNSSSMAILRDSLVSFAQHVDLTDFRLLDELIFFSALVSQRPLCLDPTLLTEYRIHSRNVSLHPEPYEGGLSGRAAFSNAFLPSYARLAGAIRATGPGPVVQEAEGLLKVQQAYGALRDPHAGRSTFAKLHRELKALRVAYLVHSERRLYWALRLFSISPWIGRRVYFWNIRSLET